MMLLAMVFTVPPVQAAVLQVIVESRTPFAEDVPGKVGPYERIRGRVVYALDPNHEANKSVVDLTLAATNGEGLVEFYADFEIIAPVDRSLAKRTVLYDINNRGRRLWGMQPFFLRHGYVTVSSGWIAEVPVDERLLRIEAPVALGEDGVPIVGLVRAELSTDVGTNQLPLASRGALAYEPVIDSLAKAELTKRRRERDMPELIPRDGWELLLVNGPQEEGSGLIEAVIEMPGGFEPGFLYDLTYEARGSVVQGAGFAAIRDFVSFLKHDGSDSNPLRDSNGQPLASRVIGEGRSQSGRALRMFLYEGFNTDEQGRQVFEGVMPVISGGGQGFFNHRFASPTRTANEHTGHLYPVDVFPFTYGEETHHITNEPDSLLRRSRADGTAPRVMHLDTTSEYWHRSASLVLTDPSGMRDTVMPDDVRVYVFGGSQHGPSSRPSDRGQLPPNPNVYQPFLETLFVAMDKWITDGTPPPRSVYPTISAGTLVPWAAERTGWTALPGVNYPTTIQQPEPVDYGSDFAETRRIDHHPPKRHVSLRYGVRVPVLDADNNERGVLRMPAVSVPVATYTGWNLRNPGIGVPEALLGLAGGYLEFPKTERDRVASGDPRRSIEERYADFNTYLEKTMRAADTLILTGYLLEEHRAGIEAVSESHRPLFAH